MAQPAASRHEGAPAVDVAGLGKRYGSTVAVQDVSLRVEEGEIFGILGPNGAGKTTTVECITGVRRADRGTIRVLGLDPGRDRASLHSVVGVQLQTAAFADQLKVHEIVDMFRSFYWSPVQEDLIEALGLADKRGSYYRSLSGGQKQRLSLAVALIGQPRLAVLDEMTAGLDPQGRHDVWDLIRGVRDRGATLLLVTHFMEEAERLCDRVALIDQGRVVAIDTPARLAESGADSTRVRFVPSAPFDDGLLSGLPGVASVTHDGSRLVVSGRGDLVNTVVLGLANAGVRADDLTIEAKTLEDAFLRLTGHHFDRGSEAMH